MIPIKMLDERAQGRISILLPSRGRGMMLGESITSLRKTAAEPWNLEFLVAYDPDDQVTRRVANAYDVDVVWEAPERYGYAGSARYYAALLEYSTGEWLLPTWGDDGIMLTEGWDEIVRAQPTPAVLYTTGGDRWGNNCFPIVSADVLVATGRLCDLPELDTWYDEVGRLAGVRIEPSPPIKVRQDRFDLTGRNHDSTYVEGTKHYHDGDHGHFYLPKWSTWRQEDARMVRAMLAGRPPVTQTEERGMAVDGGADGQITSARQEIEIGERIGDEALVRSGEKRLQAAGIDPKADRRGAAARARRQAAAQEAGYDAMRDPGYDGSTPPPKATSEDTTTDELVGRPDRDDAKDNDTKDGGDKVTDKTSSSSSDKTGSSSSSSTTGTADPKKTAPAGRVTGQAKQSRT